MTVKDSQVYKSGASTTSECLCCGTCSTSGSWRKGWTLPDGQSFVCLCNKCGQRWQKAGRPGSLVELQEVERQKAAGGAAPAPPKRRLEASSSRPAAQDAHASLINGIKRLRLPSFTAPAVQHSLLGVQPRRRLFSGDSSDSSDGASSSEEAYEEHHTATAFGSASNVPRPPAPHSSLQQLHAQAQAQAQAQALTRAPPPLKMGGPPRFVSYCVQSLSSGKARHAAFWLQDAHGESTLAVVGTDARLSGHFVYSTTPSFLALGLAPPLRCTNRAGVEAWLAAFGCTECVAEGCVRLPELSAEDRRRVLSPEEPIWARPAALTGTWAGVREESGRLTDGRHFKRFWLLGPGGAEKLVVSGVDSARQDRRYKYLASEEMGGFAFENAREVLGWVNHALGRPAHAPPLEAQQVRAAAPLREEDLGSLVPRLRAAAQLLERTPPPPFQQQPAATTAAGRAAAAASARPGGAGHERPSPSRLGGGWSPAASVSPGGKVRPPPPPPLHRPDGGEGEGEAMDVDAAAQLCSPPAAAATATTLPPPAPAAVASLPPPPPAVSVAVARGLRCGLCGVTGHGGDDCLLASLSPSCLIRTNAVGSAAARCAHSRTLSLLLFSGAATPRSGGGRWADGAAAPPHRTLSALLPSPPASGGSGQAEEEAWQPIASPQLLTASELCEQLRAALVQEAAALETAASRRTVSADVKRALAADPHLLEFAAAAPSDAARQTVEHWARKLGGHVSDLPPPLPTCAEDTPLGGWSWTPTEEALAILQALSMLQVNLSLLQSTGISAAVAQLRSHRCRELAVAAERIVAKWRGCAVAVLEAAERRG